MEKLLYGALNQEFPQALMIRLHFTVSAAELLNSMRLSQDEARSRVIGMRSLDFFSLVLDCRVMPLDQPFLRPVCLCKRRKFLCARSILVLIDLGGSLV